MKNQLAWILGLFFASTLISQSLMDLFSIVLSLFLVYHVVKKTDGLRFKDLFPKIGFDYLWIVWFAVVALGFALNSPSPSRWLVRLVEFKWILILYLIIKSLMIVRPSENSSRWMKIFFIFTSVVGIAMYLYDLTLVHPSDYFARLGGFFDDPMCFAHIQGMYISVVFGVFITRLQTLKKIDWLEFFTLLAMGIALVLSYTRGVWVGTFIAFAIAACYLGKKWGLAMLGLLSTSILVLYKVWPTFQERVNFVLDAQNNYDNTRLVLWKTNWVIFKDYPLLGIGYGENSRNLRHYYDLLNVPPNFFESHAHNQYIHLLAGTGLLGLLCYLGILIGFFVLSLRVYRQIPQANIWHKGLALGSMAAQIEFAVGGLTEANFEHSKVRFVLMLVWGLTAWLAHEYLQKNSKSFIRG